MYHAIEAIVVTVVVCVAVIAVLNRYARPLMQPARRILATWLTRRHNHGLMHRVGTRLATEAADASCGSGCGSEGSGCGSCSQGSTNEQPIRIVRNKH